MRAVSVAAVLVLAMVVRWQVVVRAEAVASDAVTHLSMAKELGVEPPEEVLRAYDYHPGYAGVVALVGHSAGAESPEQWIAVGRGVSLVAGMAALVCFYVISRAAFSHTIALLGLLVVGLSPRLTGLSCDAISDTTALVAALGAVTLGIYAGRSMRHGRFRAIAVSAAAGLAAGAAYLVRPEALLAGGIAAVGLLPVGRVSRRGKTIAVLSLVALAATAAVCVLPYANIIGGLTQKKSVEDFLGIIPAGGAMLAFASAGPKLPVAFWQVLDRGRAAMGNTVFALTVVCWVTWLVHYVLRVRLPDGILQRPRRDVAAMMAAALGVMVPLLTALEMQRAGDGRYVSSRHMLLPALLAAPAAGAGLVVLAGWAIVLTRRLGKKPRPQVAILLCLTVAAVAMVAETTGVLHEGKAPYRAAGGAVRFTLGDGARGLMSQRRVAFYAGSPPVQFRRDTAGRFRIRAHDLASPQTLLDRAERAGDISYVAIDRGLLKRSPNPEIILQLKEQQLFDPLGVFGVGEPNEVHVFILRQLDRPSSGQ